MIRQENLFAAFQEHEQQCIIYRFQVAQTHAIDVIIVFFGIENETDRGVNEYKNGNDHVWLWRNFSINFIDSFAEEAAQ